MKYTFFWSHSREEEKIIVMNRKDALKVIRRFKKHSKFCDSLFLYLSRKDVPSYQGNCFGYYYRMWDKTEFRTMKEEA